MNQCTGRGIQLGLVDDLHESALGLARDRVHFKIATDEELACHGVYLSEEGR